MPKTDSIELDEVDPTTWGDEVGCCGIWREMTSNSLPCLRHVPRICPVQKSCTGQPKVEIEYQNQVLWYSKFSVFTEPDSTDSFGIFKLSDIGSTM